MLNHDTIQHHRVSGYYTSSQSSLVNLERGVPPPDLPQLQVNSNPVNPSFNAAVMQKLRKQSDLQLIKCVKDNAQTEKSYLMKPPVNKFSLYFQNTEIEDDFRSKAHRFGSESEHVGPPTLATPRYNTYLDILIGIIIYIFVTTPLLLWSPISYTPNFLVWFSIFLIFAIVQVLTLIEFTRQMCKRNRLQNKLAVTCMDKFFEGISSWYQWHICLAIMMSCPVIVIMVNFLYLDSCTLKAFEYHYGLLLFVCIVHFCNFTQLNCWMRNCLAIFTGICFVVVSVGQIHTCEQNQFVNATRNESELSFEEVKSFSDYHFESFTDLALLLCLVTFLNRKCEVGYRLTFYGNYVANKAKEQIELLKNQADELLQNIIPQHVAEELRKQAKYSENHHNVGIIFASITNFQEMYDEAYKGGQEYLRVLNELIGDFEELLERKEFKCVEKIKTIGSTFMAASGLDPKTRGNNNEHIEVLMDFAIEMQEVVTNFNKDLLEFDLIIRIGMNVGDVAAGVIGMTKLHYDIWGDAVNVASRMDSTGVPGRIQVGSECKDMLESKFEFEERGRVYVKGKDHMEVFLLKGRRLLNYSDADPNEENEGNGCVLASSSS